MRYLLIFVSGAFRPLAVVSCYNFCKIFTDVVVVVQVLVLVVVEAVVIVVVVVVVVVERSNLGCRTLIYHNFSKILTGISADLTDWVVKTRLKSAQLLYTLMLNEEDNVTQHLEKLLTVIYKACMDDELGVVEYVSRSRNSSSSSGSGSGSTKTRGAQLLWASGPHGR